MEAVKEKAYALPFYGLHIAGAPTPDATPATTEEVPNGQEAFFVMG